MIILILIKPTVIKFLKAFLYLMQFNFSNKNNIEYSGYKCLTGFKTALVK